MGGAPWHRVPLECEILTLTLWALHRKNEVKIGSAPLARSRSAASAPNSPSSLAETSPLHRPRFHHHPQANSFQPTTAVSLYEFHHHPIQTGTAEPALTSTAPIPAASRADRP